MCLREELDITHEEVGKSESRTQIAETTQYEVQVPISATFDVRTPND